jgi:hypothetical protein
LAAMYGVHKAVAGDLRGNGKKDVIAVGYLPDRFFPQREAKKIDSMIYLEQTSPGHFIRHTLESETCDHVSCILGDVFGAGRLDLVVGNYGAKMNRQPITVWQNQGRINARRLPGPGFTDLMALADIVSGSFRDADAGRPSEKASGQDCSACRR